MVSLEITRQNVAISNTISPIGAPVMEALQRGKYKGEEVTLKDTTSSLDDQKEEIGMHISGHASHDEKTLSQKKLRQGQGTNLDALTRIADSYNDKLPDMPREVELKILVDLLQSFEEAMNRAEQGEGTPPTAEDILAALQQFDPDVTHQFAGLDVARQFFDQKATSPAFQAILEQAGAFFEQTDVARDVRAGFAAAVVAKQNASTLETDPSAIRESYRAMLREKMGFGQLFDKLCQFDMTKHFEEAVATFMEAAGRDLSAADSSVDPQFLSALLQELGKLKKMKTVFESAQELIDKSQRIFEKEEQNGGSKKQKNQFLLEEDEEEKGTDPILFTSKFLNFCSKNTVNLLDAKTMLVGLDHAPPAHQVVFANGIRALHSDVPDEVMPSEQARLQQVATIMTLLNGLVAAEEEAYQNENDSTED